MNVVGAHASRVPEPTEGQVRLVAAMLEAGIPAADAVDLVAPEIEVGARPLCAESWPILPAVMKERVRLNGGQTWLDMDEKSRITYALKLVYASMAYYLYAHPIAGLVGPALAKATQFTERLEKQQAGNAGAQSGFEEFLAKFASDEKLAHWVVKTGVHVDKSHQGRH